MDPLAVYKRLPRKNCGRCPPGTCMAFAVQFLRRMITLTECPELDDESRMEIDAFLADAGDWKERRVKELSEEIQGTNLSGSAEALGARYEDGSLSIRYLGRDIHLDNGAFREEIDIWDKLLVLMYLKQSGKGPLTGRWVAFRDLKDGMIRSETFHDECEMPLAQMFDSHGTLLVNKLVSLGADRMDGFATDISYVLNVLPRIPFLILIWAGDEEFDADCKILLDSSAAAYLDVEALLYLGISLIRAVKG